MEVHYRKKKKEKKRKEKQNNDGYLPGLPFNLFSLMPRACGNVDRLTIG
jgi:hypothetical protein